MIDIEIVRNNPELVKQAMSNRQKNPEVVDKLSAVDEDWRQMTQKVDDLRQAQKELSDKRDIEGAKANKLELKKLEEELKNLAEKRLKIWADIPNIPNNNTPIGPDESGNTVIRQWGTPRKFDFTPKDHVELGESLGILDMERASKVSGSRFYYMFGDLVKLEYALVQLVMNTLSEEDKIKEIASSAGLDISHNPFKLVIPPAMVKEDVFRGSGRLSDADADDKFKLTNDDLYLIGSAEHSLVPIHKDETLDLKDFPIRYAALSPSYRREAGSYGKDTRGIIRVHQFDKFEMVSITSAENSDNEFRLATAIQEYFMQKLDIPYQVKQICTGDMGVPDIEQIDIEAWIPSQNKYVETHTADYNGDYQARRLNIRHKNQAGKSTYAHIGDATAISMCRTLVAILENYQTEDGKIQVPVVLRSFIGKDVIG
jgi:seryl-tRNA synthetase